jgi:hypothetical protein
MLNELTSDRLFGSIENFRTVLQAEGVVVPPPRYDAEANTWDLFIKHQFANFLVIFDIDDPEFVRIDMPFICEFQHDQLDAAYRTASELNRICKGAKVSVLPRHLDVSASIEFLDVGTFTASQLLRYFSMLINAARRFREALRATAPTVN